MTANIISNHKLKDTHNVHYDNDTDMFTAVPLSGPTLTFVCFKGHYIMNLDTVAHAYVVTTSAKTAKYSSKQLAGSLQAYEFMQRMGYISYKAAAEIIQRGSIKDLPFTRSDLVTDYPRPLRNSSGIPAWPRCATRHQDQRRWPDSCT